LSIGPEWRSNRAGKSEIASLLLAKIVVKVLYGSQYNEMAFIFISLPDAQVTIKGRREMFKKAALNPVHIILMEIFIFALVGVPFAYIFDKRGYFFFLTRNVPQDVVVKSYLWTLYAFLTIIVLFYILRINKRIKIYQARDIVHLPQSKYMLIWLGSFILALLCTVFLFWQSGFSHPFFSALGLDRHLFAVKRIITFQSLNMNVYNAGLKIFASLALTIALFVLRKFWVSALSIMLLLVIATFSLQKSPLAEIVLLLAFIYTLLRKPSYKTVSVLIFSMISIIGIMYFLSGAVSSLTELWHSYTERILYGEFADLPYYFDLFRYERLKFSSILPPYIQSLSGGISPGASRLVIEYTNPQAVSAGIAGFASSIFIGEAYAFWGTAGVIAAPFWVIVNYFIMTYVFTSVQKNVYTVFFFGYLINNLTTALFRGFGYFVFSSIQIIFGFLLYLFIIAYFAGHSKPAVLSVKDTPACN